ncbi:MAG TPA: MCE family protein [Actinomycetota bacterium]|nr:MCE family protein [Actinomycetota bacterium]
MARSARFSKVTLVKVLAFVAVSAVFTAVLAMKIGNLQFFTHRYQLSAVFSDATGVFKGDAVKLAGVDVGRVSDAHIQDGHGVVDFTLDDSVKLTRDATVAIRWRNVLGQRFLYLYPGSGRGPALKDGDTIGLSNTEDAGDLGQLLNELGPILKAIDPNKANAFLDAMNEALANNEGTVRDLLTEGGGLAQRLAGMDSQIQTLVTSSNTVISTYARQDQAIKGILDDLNSVGGSLNGMTGNIDSLIVNFAKVQQELDRFLKENRGNIDSSLGQLQWLVQLLHSKRAELAQTLCSLPAGVAPYFQTTSWGEWFNVRVIRITLKDNQDNTLVSQGETPQERGDTSAGKPYTCGTTVPGTGVNPDEGQNGPGLPGVPGLPGTPGVPGAPGLPGTDSAGFTGLGGFLQSVLQGVKHA